MKKNALNTALAVLLTLTIITPSAFLAIPPSVRAEVTAVPADEEPWSFASLKQVAILIEETLIEIQTYTSMVADVANYVNTYVLQPLAFVMSGNLLKSLTAGVISFVVGKTNGTGAPQFVRNVQGTMQSVGDKSALAFFAQFNSNSNSPFAASIRSSLATNYMQNTSLAGFWGANQNTLYKSSPNPNAFLSGRWSQGGVAAWFSLTTQSQNNPYLFYQASQAQLSNLVANATAARLSQLNWGQGFGSWCGTSDAATERENSAATGYAACVADCNESEGGATCVDACASLYNSAGGAFGGQAGVNPGEPCTNKDGTPGTVQTPGSTIKATLDKVLGSTQAKLEAMGNVGTQMGKIMGDITSVMNTVNFASQILGGSGGGLFTVGGGGTSGSNSRLAQFAPFQTPSSIGSNNYLGASSAGIYNGASGIPLSGPEKSKLLGRYETAWTTIQDETKSASSKVNELIVYCEAAAVTATGMSASNSCEQSQKSAFLNKIDAQVVSARSVLATEITPVLTQADTISPIVCAARAMIDKIQCELNAEAGEVVYCDRTCDANNNVIPDPDQTRPTNTTAEYTEDLQTLQTMPPSAEDVVKYEQKAQVNAGAQAVPSGSLNVPGIPSIADQMRLIGENAEALKTSVCSFADACVAGQACSAGRDSRGQNIAGVCLSSKFGNVCVPADSACLPRQGGNGSGGWDIN